ncbi:hypothetical protein ACFQMH_23325 [Streptomyces viridiviolaceus]|uniref:Uncharacterized protein n=1 Tax=Streptomyces viridiviolaceus TaxID=68282 RepID=A0ABW2E3N7_9ACTN|nr:hypothetical protein [Streptomyces viridiviolaceus]
MDPVLNVPTLNLPAPGELALGPGTPNTQAGIVSRLNLGPAGGPPTPAVLNDPRGVQGITDFLTLPSALNTPNPPQQPQDQATLTPLTANTPDFTQPQAELQQPQAEQPTTEEPVTEAPVTEEPAVEEPVTEAPVTQEPAVEEPVTEAPVTQEPAVEEPTTE